MKKFAIVFPGQGSQSVGMLNAFAGNEAVRQTVAEASEVLGQDLAAMIAQGPAEVLGLTTNTQPVMLTACVAFYRAWLAAGGPQPNVAVAGHSLGEYAAWVASGVIRFEDALPLVRFRAQAMQSAVPVGEGGMAAILGLDAAKVVALCAEAALGDVLEAANFNDPVQTVIAGHRAAVERACTLSKERGAKRAVVLPVSAPFHCALMRPAAHQLYEYLQAVPFQKPAIDVINNVDVATVRDTAAIKDALVRQAWSAVRWVETVEMLRDLGATRIIECGPGKVLTGLTRRIDKELTGVSINDPESLCQALEVLA